MFDAVDSTRASAELALLPVKRLSDGQTAASWPAKHTARVSSSLFVFLPLYNFADFPVFGGGSSGDDGFRWQFLVDGVDSQQCAAA